MKTIFTMVLIFMVIVMGLTALGSILSTWSDNNNSEGNCIETGSLDLRVAQCDATWTNYDKFNDDLPWGSGLKACFNIPDAHLGQTYTAYILLWNAGTVDGTASFHVNSKNNNLLFQSTYVNVWYDHDGVPETPMVLVQSCRISEMAGRDNLIGQLPGNAIRRLKIELHPDSGLPGESVNFDIQFVLLQKEHLSVFGWSDSEVSANYIRLKELGGNPSFWRGSQALNRYCKSCIVGWFGEIVLTSGWFEDSLITGSEDQVYDRMVTLLVADSGDTYRDKINQFRAQYLALRLNTMPYPPRLLFDNIHDASSVNGASSVFGSNQIMLAQVIDTIEANADSDIFNPPPGWNDVMTMKGVCEMFNSP